MSHPAGMIGRMRENVCTKSRVFGVEQPKLLEAPGPEGKVLTRLKPGKPAIALSESTRLVGLEGVAKARKALEAAALRSQATAAGRAA
jgi:hypothetical protein